MKKLLTILSLLFLSVVSNSQSEVIRNETFGFGSQQMTIYQPAGWDSYVKKPLLIFCHGAGERGTNISLVDNTALPLYLANNTVNLKMFVMSPQYAANVTFYDPDETLAAINHAITNYGVDPNMIYLGGYSLGAWHVANFIELYPGLIAGAHPVAGDYDQTTAETDSLLKIPFLITSSTGDATQNISETYRLLDSLVNPNHPNRNYLPQTDFYYNLSHGSLGSTVFSAYETKYQGWLLLHEKRIDSTAEFHVDSLEKTFTWDLFKRSQVIVSKLTAGAHKTNLLNRLIAKELAVYGTGFKTATIDLGTPANTTAGINNLTNAASGQAIANLIDQNAANTGWTFTIVTTANTNESDYGEPGGYWNLPSTAFSDGFQVFDNVNASNWRFSNLNNAKTYTIRMTGGVEGGLAGEEGFIATINGVSDTMTQQLRNTNKYVEFVVANPASGQISINLRSIGDNGQGLVAIIEITEAGTGATNNPPVANAGSDQGITHPTTSTSLNGSATDADGTVASHTYSFVSGPTTPTITTPSSYTSGITGLSVVGTYIFNLLATDDDGDSHNDQMSIVVSPAATPLSVSVGIDTVRFYGQSGVTPPFKQKGIITSGTATTYSWSVLSGPNAPTITNGNTLTATFSNTTKGNYVIRLGVSDGVNTAADTLNVWVRDLMQKGLRPCRVGTKIKDTLGDVVGGGITTTTYSTQYITRDNLAPNLLGGDTLVIMRNPNNGGIWNDMKIGDISGGPGCPIVIVPGGIVEIRNPTAGNNNGLFLGSLDSNVVSYVKFDGTWKRPQTGEVYGFQIGNPTLGNSNLMFRGIAGNLVHHTEFVGFAVENTGTGVTIKIVSDSSKPYRYFDNFRITGNRFSHMWVTRSDNEAFYMGHTDPAGATQGGNDGPVVYTDSTFYNYIIIDSAAWDGFQVSWGGYVDVKNIYVRRTGVENSSGQIFSAFGGGWTQVTFDSCMFTNQRGGPGFLGMGRNTLKNSIIDSLNGMFNSQAYLPGVPIPLDSLQIYITNNIWTRHFGTDPTIKTDDTQAPGLEKYKPGAYRYNTFEDTRTIGQIITTEYGDTVELNTIRAAINLDTSKLALSLPAYKIHKIMTHPNNNINIRHSFFEVLDLKRPDFRMRGKRFRFKRQ